MYVTVEDFIAEWNKEAGLTQGVLDGMTDEALGQRVYPEGRTLGRIAWHLTANIPEYLAEFGVPIEGAGDSNEVPSAREIAETFRTNVTAAADAIRKRWTDDSLKLTQNAFGRTESNAMILMGLIKHIVHHRGQLTVLMRQAGVPVPAVYGPSKEIWARMGVTPPL